MGNDYCVCIDKGYDNENDDNNKIRKRHFIGVSRGNDINNCNNSKRMNTEVCEYNKVSKIKGVNK